MVIAPVVYWDGGVLEEETISFLRHYLDGRPLVRQVLDTHTNDFGTYQARELSYLVDAMDARVFRSLLVRNHVLFINLSSLVAGLLTVVLVGFAAPSVYPRLSRTLALLGLLVYLSTVVLSSTEGVFYRATKPLVAPCLLAALFSLRMAARESDSMVADSCGQPWSSVSLPRNIAGSPGLLRDCRRGRMPGDRVVAASDSDPLNHRSLRGCHRGPGLQL
jgi:hypothetical protein